MQLIVWCVWFCFGFCYSLNTFVLYGGMPCFFYCFRPVFQNSCAMILILSLKLEWKKNRNRIQQQQNNKKCFYPFVSVLSSLYGFLSHAGRMESVWALVCLCVGLCLCWITGKMISVFPWAFWLFSLYVSIATRSIVRLMNILRLFYCSHFSVAFI